MSNVVEFATDRVRRAERTEYWRELAWSELGDFDVIGGDDGLHASARLRTLGSLRIGRVAARPHRVVRSHDQSRGDDRRIYKIVLQHSGHMFLEQRDKRVALSPGDWTIYDLTRAFSFSCTEETRQSAMFVRAEDLRLNDLTPYSLRLFSGASGYSSLLQSAIATAVGDSARNCADGDIGTMLARLARLAILEHGSEEARRSSREIMRERIDGYLDTHLRRSDLSIDSMASALHCSKRYLHKVFLETGETLSEHILQRRLHACRLELIDPASPHQTVTDIAYAWGFSSLAYFSRVFKQAYDVSPRDYRTRALVGALMPAVAA